jgi:hypothetical protein
LISVFEYPLYKPRYQPLTFRLEIPIYESHQMQVFQSRDDLGSIKLSVLFS